MIKNAFILLLQYLLPQHLLSRVIGKFANCKSVWLKNLIIRNYVRIYRVEISEAVATDSDAYVDFNSFFTRALRPEVRPISTEPHAVISPVDGTISQIGKVTHGQIIQAKKHYYNVIDLLGGDAERADPFINGHFLTAYLSPRDYHRVHMPITGKLTDMIYIPGKLFSVQNATVKHINKLFTRNERVITLFETELGPMAMVLVGAINVASIHTRWHGAVTPSKEHDIRQWCYPNPKTEAITLQRGEEMGHFELGSTVIVLFPQNTLQWSTDCTAGSTIKFGQAIALTRKS